MSFILDKRLENDSCLVIDLQLSQVRLVNNANFPWVIIVPRLKSIVEITDLTNEQYHRLNIEVLFVAKAMQRVFEPDKLNIATIGNKVRQLHYHVVARYKNDMCFPDPVWGAAKSLYVLED